MTTNSPQRWHLITTPRFSSLAVSRPQMQRTSLSPWSLVDLFILSLRKISGDDCSHTV